MFHVLKEKLLRHFLPFEAREKNLSFSFYISTSQYRGFFLKFYQVIGPQTLSTDLPLSKPWTVTCTGPVKPYIRSRVLPARPIAQGMHLPSHPLSDLSPYLLEAIVLLTVGAIPAVAIPIWHYRVLIAEPAVHCHVCGLLPVRKGNMSGMSTDFS